MPRKRINYQKVVAYLLLVAAFILTPWLMRAFYTAFQTHTWPKTEAIIYTSEVNYGTAKVRQSYYTVNIRYRYQVNGKRYIGSKIYRTNQILSQEQAENLTGQFTTGSLQHVYYDTADPQQSVLNRGASKLLYILLAVDLLFIGFGLRSRLDKQSNRKI